MFGHDAEDLCSFNGVLGLSTNHDLLAHERELNRAIGKCRLDFPFQDLDRLLKSLDLGLQAFPLGQQLECGTVRVGLDHDRIAQGPIPLRVVGIARIRKPEVKDRRTWLLADDG